MRENYLMSARIDELKTSGDEVAISAIARLWCARSYRARVASREELAGMNPFRIRYASERPVNVQEISYGRESG